LELEIYKPTAYRLESVIPRLTKGSIIGFGELNDHYSVRKIGCN